MDQVTARRLAKLMSDRGNGLIYVAMTNYAMNGEFDEPDAVWGVTAYGFGGRTLITTVPDEFFGDMMDLALAGLADTIKRSPKQRPVGEEIDADTVDAVRSILSDVYNKLYGEDLAMRPTVFLVERVCKQLMAKKS